jgi:hypothetical protein
MNKIDTNIAGAMMTATPIDFAIVLVAGLVVVPAIEEAEA